MIAQQAGRGCLLTAQEEKKVNIELIRRKRKCQVLMEQDPGE
jgi:hypothetical protein